MIYFIMKIKNKIEQINKEIDKLDIEIKDLYAISAFKLHQIKINERRELLIILRFLTTNQNELKNTNLF